MKSSLYKIMIVVLACSICFSGCRKYDKFADSSDQGLLVIVTSFYPIYISALNVAKGIPDVKVVNMTKNQTGCLHDYQLSPADLKTLENSDVFVVNGAGMESFMDNVIKQMPGIKVIEASEGIELLKNKTNGEVNGHVWVSISNVILQVKNISAHLAALDPDNAEKYDENAVIYIEKLEILKSKMHSALDNVKNKDIVTFHEAFPYFAKEFDLNVVAVIEREPGSEPNAGDLADTIRIIRETGVTALFAEPQYSAKAAQSIANQTGAKVFTLDPMVTGPDNPGPDDYLKVMDANLNTLAGALKNGQ